MRRNIFSSYTKESDLEAASVNLTPLIDVVFVVLIMFIIIAPLLNVDRVELASGDPEYTEDQINLKTKSNIAIHVRRNNSIYFNGAPVNIDQLKEMLVNAKKLFPGESPQVFHDKSAFFGTYQEVKNAVEAAGYPQMDIVLNPRDKR